MRRDLLPLFASLFVAFSLLAFVASAQAKDLRVTGILTSTREVTDLLATPTSYFVATQGGVEEYDRASKRLVFTYTPLDGLLSPHVDALSRKSGGSLIAQVGDKSCELRGRRFVCANGGRGGASAVRFEYEAGVRITKRLALPEGQLVGTAGRGVLLDGQHLSPATGLPGPHVTALAVFRDSLWIGTFNRGLARQDPGEILRPIEGPNSFINALQATSRHLFVGTSEGLFRTENGRDFTRVEFVEDAVVGLAHDGTSLWASTPGALYRIRDGKGPPSDVWWLPGGSRSLQKVSAVPGHVWIGTEDRGAVHMRTTSKTMAKDKPFTVFDRTAGLPSSWSLAVAALPDGGAVMTTLREGTSAIDAAGAQRALRLPVGDWGLSTLAEAGGVWLGTQDGAAFYDLNSGTATRVHGLPDERVHVIYRDPRRPTRVYFGTENGLAWCDL